MPTLNSFPDLGKHFQLMKIKDKLLGLNPDDGLLTMSIVDGVESGKLVQVVSMIKDQAKDNRMVMSNLIGEELLTSIENI
jgi:hypothetical protein